MKSWRLRARGAALTFCISSLLAATGQASAADLYGRPGLKDGPVIDAPPAWEGLYVGGNVGGAWTTATVDDHYDYVGDPLSSNNLNGGGIVGGGQIGYNFQWGNIVFGPEADLGYLGLSGSRWAALNSDAGFWRTTRETCADSMRITRPPAVFTVTSPAASVTRWIACSSMPRAAPPFWTST